MIKIYSKIWIGILVVVGGLFFSSSFAIELNSGNVTQAPFSCATNATSCNLSSKSITYIASGTFINHTGLQTLNLNSNQLTGLLSESFVGLYKLQSLNINNNQITGSLNTGLFQGLTGLTDIQLSSNQIGSLPVGIFSGLNKLSSIYVSNNQLTQINNNLFQGLPSLVSIYFYSNKITSLPIGLFSGLSSLLTIDFSYNQLTGIDETIFLGLTGITSISLSNNLINKFPGNLFSGLSTLSTLYLSSNYQSSGSISTGLFKGLSNLVRIDFSSSNIDILPSGVFLGLTMLQDLYLNSNVLTGLNVNIFQGLININRIYINSNKFSSLPTGIFSGLNKLSTLYLHYNQFTGFDVNLFQGLTGLTNLDITSNQIVSLPVGVFSGLGKLQNIQASNNKIAKISVGVFSGLSNLQNLNLENNQIKNLSAGVFSGLSKLQILYLGSNGIRRLSPTTFQGLTSLIVLEIYNNFLKYIPVNTFSGITTMVSLPIASNCLSVATLDPSIVSYITGKNSGSFPSQNALGSTSCKNTTGRLLSDPDYVENELLWAGFQEGTGSLKTTSPTTFVGNSLLDISEVNGNITVPMILQSSGTSSSNTYEAEFASGTVVRDGSGNNYTGTLSMPVLKSTGVVTNASGSVLSVASFGGSTPLFFDTGVLIRMPAPGRNNGDLVKILYSNSNWTTGAIQTYTTVTMINGAPYVEFSTTHFTDFAVVGFGTGTFVINNDDTVTNTKNVTLNIYNPNSGVQMRFSNDGTGWSAWENYGTSKAWTMSNGGGTKTVYVQFDSNADQVADQTVSDSISYVPGGGEATSNEGDIVFTILTGGSYCIYGTTLDLGTGIVGTTVFSGNFMTASGTNTWTCSNSNGASIGGNLTVQMSGDLVNENNVNTKIGSGNVAISFGGTSFGGSLTGIVRSGSNVVLNQQVIVLGTTTTQDLRIGSMSTTGVRLQVTAPANQAPGRYQGTLVITLPW